MKMKSTQTEPKKGKKSVITMHIVLEFITAANRPTLSTPRERGARWLWGLSLLFIEDS